MDELRISTDDKKSTFGSLDVFTKLRQEMNEQKKDTVIFIHGYNVTFEEAIKAAAKMCNNFKKVNSNRGVNGALFSWPSDGLKTPYIAYANDRHDAAISGPAFARGILKLVDFLQGATKEEACKQDIHLVAHSMGNYVLRNALQEIIREKGTRLPRLFNQIFLMAADEDDDAFEHDSKLKWLPKIAKQVNVYFNRGDLAIAVSDWTKGNPARLGDDGPRLPSNVPAKVTQIDCSKVVKGVVEHSYYIDTEEVVEDMVQVLNGVEDYKIEMRRFRADRNCYVIVPPAE